MKVHSNVITTTDILDAARNAGVRVESAAVHGSRSHALAIDVRLSGSSPYNSQGGDYKAATWDEWGAVMGALYLIDPDAMWGSKAYGYKNAEDFHRKTCDRFRLGLVPDDTHPRHKWQYDYENSRPWSGMGQHYCTVDGCGARTQRG